MPELHIGLEALTEQGLYGGIAQSPYNPFEEHPDPHHGDTPEAEEGAIPSAGDPNEEHTSPEIPLDPCDIEEVDCD